MTQDTWARTHPRPQLRRERFFVFNEGWTLNGRPIRLPWPPQAELSRYGGEIGTELRYENTFVLPQGFQQPGRRTLLHFGAVDQVAEVSVNGHMAVRHEGGYLPFSADVTDLLRPGENTITVLAEDTLSRRYPYGKQHRRPHGMWYTPVSGIWQTVWLEDVPARERISSLRITPDRTGVTLEVDCGGGVYTVSVALPGGTDLTLSSRERSLRIQPPRPRLWTTEDPYLYHMTVVTGADRVESYFALREVTVEERGGYTRLMLNGQPVFLHGVLDQGYFHDGLYLPRDPEEYERDILRMKSLGFNTLRKHIKVEPEAFYCACDRLGMLVVQDMVNSGGYSYLWDTVIPTILCKKRFDRFPGSKRRRAFFEQHTLDTLAHLHNHPCIVGYTIFNEGWGQYDSDRIYRMCRQADPTRFYDSTSGWFAQRESDTQSEHIYFRNEVLYARRPGQFLFLSECGGYSRRLEEHTRQRKNYGYGSVDTQEALTGRIEEMYREMVLPSISNGLCGCIYTQLSDVEEETNGLYTYDRAVCKVDSGRMRRIAAQVYGQTEAAGAPAAAAESST